MLANTVKGFYREIKWNLIGAAHTSVCRNFVAPLIAACKSSARPIKKNRTIYGEDVFNGRFIAFPIPVVGSSLTMGPDANGRHHVFPDRDVTLCFPCVEAADMN